HHVRRRARAAQIRALLGHDRRRRRVRPERRGRRRGVAHARARAGASELRPRPHGARPRACVADCCETVVVGEARRTLHQALDELRAQIVHFATLVADGIPEVTQALLDSDLDRARRLIEGDDELDRLSFQIEENCLKLLALQQPMASDLPALVSAVKLNWELERTRDLVVNLGKVVRRIYGVELEPHVRALIEEMGHHAYVLTVRAIEAYAAADAGLAAALDDMDDRPAALPT